MQFLLHEISRPISQGENALAALAARKLQIDEKQVLGIERLRKSVDARSGRELRFKYSLLVTVNKSAGAELVKKGIKPYAPEPEPPLEPERSR